MVWLHSESNPGPDRKSSGLVMSFMFFRVQRDHTPPLCTIGTCSAFCVARGTFPEGLFHES